MTREELATLRWPSLRAMAERHGSFDEDPRLTIIPW